MPLGMPQDSRAEDLFQTWYRNSGVWIKVSVVAQMVKNLSAMQEIPIQSLVRELGILHAATKTQCSQVNYIRKQIP